MAGAQADYKTNNNVYYFWTFNQLHICFLEGVWISYETLEKQRNNKATLYVVVSFIVLFSIINIFFKYKCYIKFNTVRKWKPLLSHPWLWLTISHPAEATSVNLLCFLISVRQVYNNNSEKENRNRSYGVLPYLEMFQCPTTITTFSSNWVQRNLFIWLVTKWKQHCREMLCGIHILSLTVLKSISIKTLTVKIQPNKNKALPYMLPVLKQSESKYGSINTAEEEGTYKLDLRPCCSPPYSSWQRSGGRPQCGPSWGDPVCLGWPTGYHRRSRGHGGSEASFPFLKGLVREQEVSCIACTNPPTTRVSLCLEVLLKLNFFVSFQGTLAILSLSFCFRTTHSPPCCGLRI